MYIYSSHATLTGAEEKKTGPSRFRPLFSSVTVDDRNQPMIGIGNPIIQKPGVQALARPDISNGLFEMGGTGVSPSPHWPVRPRTISLC
jgi:hypothetical protein